MISVKFFNDAAIKVEFIAFKNINVLGSVTGYLLIGKIYAYDTAGK